MIKFDLLIQSVSQEPFSERPREGVLPPFDHCSHTVVGYNVFAEGAYGFLTMRYAGDRFREFLDIAQHQNGNPLSVREEA